MDFYQILVRETKDKDDPRLELYPDFIVGRSEDLMVQGGKFYAIWDAEKNLWSKDEYDVQRLVDEDLRQAADRLHQESGQHYTVKFMRSFNSNAWAQFRKFMAHISDNSTPLDNHLVFANSEVKKSDHASRRASVRHRRGGYFGMGRVDLYVVFAGRTNQNRVGHRLYHCRGLETHSEVLRALWSAWYGQEYDLEHYPSIIRGVYYDLRWESARKLERVFRDRRYSSTTPW
jgi:hypothetical protein